MILKLIPEKNYAIKCYNTPGDMGVWQSWQKKANTDEKAGFLANRVSKRPPVEFYDMVKDPYELQNLAGNPVHQKQIDSYTRVLKDWMKQQGDEGAVVDKVYKQN